MPHFIICTGAEALTRQNVEVLAARSTANWKAVLRL